MAQPIRHALVRTLALILSLLLPATGRRRRPKRAHAAPRTPWALPRPRAVRSHGSEPPALVLGFEGICFAPEATPGRRTGAPALFLGVAA
ncbi:hypothetical protein ABZX40_28035 [Streptomyces sp. NPDC004610]|uniref:hypothetical protein n=1 Tax=unclassified Streptomyces TaxID=2593676 RepID=UPI0033A0446E